MVRTGGVGSNSFEDNFEAFEAVLKELCEWEKQLRALPLLPDLPDEDASPPGGPESESELKSKAGQSLKGDPK